MPQWVKNAPLAMSTAKVKNLNWQGNHRAYSGYCRKNGILRLSNGPKNSSGEYDLFSRMGMLMLTG